MPIQHNIKIAGETYTNIDSLQMNGANSEEGKTIEYICPEWDNLSFNDTTPILGTHTTDKDGFKTVTIESDDLNAANIIESATIFGVEGAIPINEDADITVHGNRLTVPAGYYPSMTARTVDNGTLTVTKDFDVDTGKFTASAKVTKNGYLTSAANTSAEIQLDTANANTIYPSTSEQIAVPANRYTLGDIKVAAMEYASGSLGGDAYNGKAIPDIRYDSVEGIKTTKPSGSDFITIGASVRTEPAGYAPKYSVLQAGYIGTSLYADKETIPVIAEEEKVIYIETDDGTTVTPSTAEQTIALTGKLMQGDVVVEAMPEGTLADIELNNNNGKIEASLSISKPGYVDNTDRKTAELTLPTAQLTWNVGTVSGGCEAKITNQDNIRTVSANHDGDYYTIKATATGNDGEAGLNATNFTSGYLSTNPIEGSSYVRVPVTSDTVGKEIHIPKATLSTSGATVSVTEAGYLPAGESQTVQSGTYSATSIAAAVASVSASKGNIEVNKQSSKEEAESTGYYFKTTGVANATATAKSEITTAGYLAKGTKTEQATDSQEATAYYTIKTTSKTVTPSKGQQTITPDPESNSLLSQVIVDPIPDTYAEITGYNYNITSAGQHNIRNYNYATVAEGKVEINDDKIEFNAIVNGEVQTGDYGRPYYKIEVQQGSENTSVSATVTQSGYVTAGETIDSTSLEVAVSGAVFQSQIEDPRSITDAAADATIGYQQEVQIGAGYYPYSRVVKNGVKPTTRAQTTIGVSANDTTDKIVINATNNQTTGYVIADLDANKDSVDIQLTQGTPFIDSSTGVISATATMASGTKSVSQSKTLSLNTKSATTITPTTAEQTAVEAGVYTTGEIKVAAMPEGMLKTPYSTVYDSGLIITSYGVDTAGYLDASNKTSSKQLTTIKQYEYVPTTHDQSIVKGQWIDSAITIKGDPYLQPDNIKEGTTIFGVTGTYTAIQDYKLSGLWTFDEARLIAYAPSEPITQEINFYIHAGSGSYGSSITAEYNISYGAQLTYDNTLAYSKEVGIHTTQQGWQGQNFSGTPDTIEFTSEQYVSAKFYNWFTSVATKASGICTLQASGYPASGYVFYYNGASSVSMAEVNQGANDIAVPCDRIYIIGSTQCSLYSGITTLTPIVINIGDVKIQEFNIPLTMSDATLYINY